MLPFALCLFVVFFRSCFFAMVPGTLGPPFVALFFFSFPTFARQWISEFKAVFVIAERSFLTHFWRRFSLFFVFQPFYRFSLLRPM